MPGAYWFRYPAHIAGDCGGSDEVLSGDVVTARLAQARQRRNRRLDVPHTHPPACLHTVERLLAGIDVMTRYS
jgi:hypothetical protein